MTTSRFLLLIILVCFGLPFSVQALTIVECVNKRGESTFAERCPPGSVKKSEKRLRGLPPAPLSKAESIASIAREHPITVFTVEKCEACILVRDQLQARAIPFTEIDVAGDKEKYKQLTDVTGGVATVPTLTLDGKVFSGHNASTLDLALDEAGYPAP